MRIVKLAFVFSALALAGCASGAPAPSARSGDPECKGFYEVVGMLARERGLDFEKMLRFHDYGLFQKYARFPPGESEPGRACSKKITCEGTEYCAVVVVLSDGFEMNFLKPEERETRPSFSESCEGKERCVKSEMRKPASPDYRVVLDAVSNRSEVRDLNDSALVFFECDGVKCPAGESWFLERTFYEELTESMNLILDSAKTSKVSE